MTERKLIVFIACSLDGYIADTNGNIDFLSYVEKPGEDYGYSAFVQQTDTVIVGRKTYEKILSLVPEFPHADKKVFVISSQSQPAGTPVIFYSGDLSELVHQLKAEAGKNIYCDGGAELIKNLRTEDLIDEYIISIIPVLLGEGIPLFKSLPKQNSMELHSAKKFETGLLQLHYNVKH